jgi:hypothetical protein
MPINPEEKYTLNCIDSNDIDENKYKDENQIVNHFWAPNIKIVDALTKILNKNNINKNIIDIGCGVGPAKFPIATHILDFGNIDEENEFSIKLDLDFDKFSHSDKYFEFIYCRHTLEDIQNPTNAFNEFIRISKSGYIETPSPLAEIMTGVDVPSDLTYRGYRHHRYIVWSNFKTNTIYFLPKYPIIEHITIDTKILKKFIYILNNYSVYWNNYFYWDATTKPNIVIYRNDINFDIHKDYAKLINEAIESSIDYTNHFVSFLKEKSSSS